MRMSGRRAPDSTQSARATRLHPRERGGGGRTKSRADENRLSRRRALPRLAIPAGPRGARQALQEHGALEALLELREAGKVRFIGMSGTLPHLWDHIAMGVFDVFQIPYSIVEREHEAAIATAAQNGTGIVIRGGAAKGAPTEGKQAGLQWERWRRAHLDDLLDGMTPMEFILRFTFTNPDLDTTIVGTINPAHLQTNLDILQQGPLPPAV